jgi:hypothetical protein
MTYQKPTITLLGKAQALVMGGGGKPKLPYSDSPQMGFRSVAAYEADE